MTLREAHHKLAEPVDEAEAGFQIGDSARDPHELGAISGRSRAWNSLRADPLFWIGLVLATLVIGSAIFAPLIAPYGPEESFRELMPPDGTALPPSAQFPLGTDVAGRDYLSRLLYAGRATLLVGLGANLVATALGALVGLVAGYSGTIRVGLPFDRKLAIPIDSLLMRVTDIGLAFPVLLLAIAMAYVLGQSLALVTIIIAAVLWTTTARLVYGRVLLVRSAEFVIAAQALGCTGPRIVSRHILPHIYPLIMVTASLGIATTILFEATLSFLGAGAPIQTPTWGRLLADHVGWYRNDFRLPLLPGLAIMITVLAFNLLGDALRDALDPHGWRR